MAAVNISSGKLEVSIVSNISEFTADSILSINGGLLELSGPTSQAIWVLENGSPQLALLENLVVGMQIFDASTGEWIAINTLDTQSGTFQVCELEDTANSFIVNGIDVP
ncbi:MAG: hypothetical protein WA547_07545 [Thermoplasmata archaeon]